MDNEVFVNFTNRIGFGRLFRSYRSRHGDKELMDLFVRVANRVGLTSTLMMQNFTSNEVMW